MPPRAMAGAVLEPKLGHDNAFKVRMSWGEAVSLPAETDGGAVENGEVSITFLSRLCAVEDPGAQATGLAVGALLASSR